MQNNENTNHKDKNGHFNNYRVRLVIPGDIPDILEMSKEIYMNNSVQYGPLSADYLPVTIYYWINDPSRILIGLEDIKAKRLIGFDCQTVFEGGRVRWGEALRIHPDYRGKGLNKFFLDGVVALCDQISTHFELQRGTAVIDPAIKRDENSRLDTLSRVNIEITTKTPILINNVCNHYKFKLQPQDFKVVSPTEMFSIGKKFNSVKLIHFNWYYWDFTLQNLLERAKGDYTTSSLKYTILPKDNNNNSSNQEIKAFSISGTIPRLFLAFSAHIEAQDLETLLLFYMYHLQEAHEKGFFQISISMKLYSRNGNSENEKEILKKFFGDEVMASCDMFIGEWQLKKQAKL